MEPHISQDDTASLQKDCRDIKRNLSVVQNDSTTIIGVVAVSPNESDNRILAIPASTGVPLQHGVYDTVRDCYVMAGVAHESIGEIPVGYSLIDNEGGWRFEIPVPMKVVNRYLTERQEKTVDKFAAKYKKHQIVYVQFRLAY